MSIHSENGRSAFGAASTCLSQTSHPMNQLRVGIVGCGAVVERFHLPASTLIPELSIESLVDRDKSRAKRLADIYGVRHVYADYHEMIGKVDAAIIALPHSLIARVSEDFLTSGIPILVEKPMAVTAEEAKRLVALEERTKTPLTVGYTRRCGYGVDFIRRALREKVIGTIVGFSVEDGYPFDWQSAGADFRLEKAGGGGVLLDIGCHVLDMILFWFGDATIISSLHDSFGGIEVNALATLETREGVRGTVELSWERSLRNSAVIEGTKGRLEVEWYRNLAHAYLGGSVIRGTVTPEECKDEAQDFDMMFVKQLREWSNSLRGESQENVLATASDAQSVLELVEAWRDHGKAWDPEWSSTRFMNSNAA
jgi:predicted dehydrogenase